MHAVWLTVLWIKRNYTTKTALLATEYSKLSQVDKLVND